MYDFIKQYIVAIITPIPFITIMMLVGLWLLWFKRPRSGKIYLTLGTLLFIIIAYSPLAQILVVAHEKQYPSLLDFKNLNHIKYVVVLGGGNLPDKTLPLTSQVGGTLVRVIEGIRIHRKIPNSKIIFTGKGIMSEPESITMKKLTLELGVPPEEIITEEESMNTREHTKYLRPILRESEFILVTSSMHISRAMRTFRATGMKPIAAPTGQVSRIGTFSKVGNLAAMDSWLYEYYGAIWSRIQGY